MRSHRFYTAFELLENTSVELPPEAVHHCVQVLRYATGDPLILFNGDGFDYPAVISEINKKRCVVKINNRYDPKNESPLRIHLMQAIARGDKMDFIIQKAVELGVTEITPVFTERCHVKLDAKRLSKKLEHWNKTIVSASEQSGRAALAKLNRPVTVEQIEACDQCSVYLEPTADESFKQMNIDKSVRIMIGPEGGFSTSDQARLKHQQFKGVKMGARILRTETAGLTSIALLQSLHGDFC